jgi:hypothetical protein
LSAITQASPTCSIVASEPASSALSTSSRSTKPAKVARLAPSLLRQRRRIDEEAPVVTLEQ